MEGLRYCVWVFVVTPGRKFVYGTGVAVDVVHGPHFPVCARVAGHVAQRLVSGEFKPKLIAEYQPEAGEFWSPSDGLKVYGLLLDENQAAAITGETIDVKDVRVNPLGKVCRSHRELDIIGKAISELCK